MSLSLSRLRSLSCFFPNKLYPTEFNLFLCNFNSFSLNYFLLAILGKNMIVSDLELTTSFKNNNIQILKKHRITEVIDIISVFC